MSTNEPQPTDEERDEQVEASQDDDKQLDDLEPDEDEATEVQGGQQMQDSAWSLKRI